MKGAVVFLFLLLVPCVSAVWNQFQFDEINSGKVNGTGYFGTRAIINITNDTVGMKYQPMVADIDNDGNKEIIIFSGGYLKIFDKYLTLINETYVGTLRGQFDIENMDSDSYIEVIAILNNSGIDYYQVWEYDSSDFNIDQNFSVNLQGGYQDIKCIDFDMDGNKECIFRDYYGMVHSYQSDATSIADDELNINIGNNNTSYSIINLPPSIVDFDDDNDLDALFWFNDTFTVIDGNSNVVLSKDVGTLNTYEWQASGKLSPFLGSKFVNLDNSNKYKIAAAWREDVVSGRSFKASIHLAVYNLSGNIQFQKTFDFGGNYCYLNGNKHCFGYGSDIFTVDYDNDGFEDIGIYLDDGWYSAYGTYIKFFDRNGTEIASNAVLIEEDTMTGEAVTLADMDNDNEYELILQKAIYNLDGSIAYKLSHDNYVGHVPIAVDVDDNNALDLISVKDSNITIFLDNFSYSYDLAIEEKDILFQLNSTKIVIYNYGSGLIQNAEILVLNIGTTENTTYSVNVPGNSNVTINSNISLSEDNELLIQLDYNGNINESNEKNNFAFKTFEGFPYVFVSADLEINSLENEFKDFIEDNLKSSYYVDNEIDASVKVYIGKNNLFNKQKILFTKSNYDYYYDFGDIYHKDEIGSYPYNGLIGAYKESDVIYILIYGNEISGNIAAVKEFINNEVDFLNIDDEKSYFVDNENQVAVKVFDFLHNTGNEDNYMLDNTAFRQIVRNALRDEMYTEQDYTVASASGINLRLRNLKPNASTMYLSYLNDTGIPVELPVVLAHGLFSNLSTWQVLASEISNTGRDTWLIEITGGTGQDCDNCTDYTFQDLIEDYWPSLLNGVLSNTGKSTIQYVGFSNGCRTGLSSLEENYFDSNKIDTFVGVGCPGAFENSSPLGNIISSRNRQISQRLDARNISHVSLRRIISTGLLDRNYISIDTANKISLNIWKFYEDAIILENDTQLGNINVSNFAIIQGNAFGSSDGIVTVEDEKNIYQNANKNSNPKKYFNIFASHTGLENKRRTKSIINKLLNNKELSFYERTINLINQSG